MVVVTVGNLAVDYAVDGFHYSFPFAPNLCSFFFYLYLPAVARLSFSSLVF